ncbi:MAG TPA: lysophospholipase [Aldersonia sp.]
MPSGITPSQQFTISSADDTDIVAYRWDPAATPTSVTVLVHGMGEHALRYADVAAALNERGAVVYGYDHRGHGQTVAGAGLEPGDLGAGGWEGLVDDIGLVVTKAREENPGLPVLLIGHSMGSFASQQYLLDHSGDVDAAVLSGTASIDLLEPALGDLDGPMDLAAFNARFEPARTGYEWLSRDEEQVDRYVADPMCGFGIDATAAKGMFVGARRLADPANIEIRNDLPIYIVVGSYDPVNGELALVNPLVDRLRAAGVDDVTLKVYDEARHEVFNETNRDEVIDDLLAWADDALKVTTG